MNAQMWEKLRGWCDFVINVALRIDEDYADRVRALSSATGLPVLATDGNNTFTNLARIGSG